MIRLEGLTKRFGHRTAVEDLDFQVQKGEIFAYLGPNGAGKTTTQRLLMGLLKPTAGKGSVGGHDIVQDSLQVRQITGFMPDTPFLYEFMTARDFLAFVAQVHERSAAECLSRISDLLDQFELTERLDTRLSNFSYGMSKKISLAALLSVEPRVLLLDEPTTGMDPRSVKTMKNVIRDLASRGVTIMLSTHTLSVAEELCDRVAILSHGKVIALGTPGQLLAKVRSGTGDLESVFLELTEQQPEAEVAPPEREPPREEPAFPATEDGPSERVPTQDEPASQVQVVSSPAASETSDSPEPPGPVLPRRTGLPARRRFSPPSSILTTRAGAKIARFAGPGRGRISEGRSRRRRGCCAGRMIRTGPMGGRRCS